MHSKIAFAPGSLFGQSPTADSSEPLYAAVDGRATPLGDKECLFQPRAGGEPHVITHHERQALEECREFRPLADHVTRMAGGASDLAGQHEAVRRILADLNQRGLLRSDADFLTSLCRVPPRAMAPFKGIVIRACDRPAQLAVLLDSLGSHRQTHSRRDSVLVIDDSRSAGSDRTQRKLLRKYGDGAGTEVVYVGRDESRTIAARMIKTCPLARAAIESLLLPRHDATFGGGRACNLALLLTAGGRLALLDDDYRLPFRRGEDFRSGVDLNPRAAFTVRFHTDTAAALTAGEALAEDGLALQQGIVGSSVGELVGGRPGFALEPAQLRGQSMQRLAHLRRDDRIVATYTGTRGASFTSDSTWLYGIDRASREDFWRDRDSYVRGVAADSLVVAPRRAVLRPFGLFTPFGLDNSELLPCTAPTGRGEDGLFGVVASYVYPDSATLHLPITIGHVQESRRARYERAMRAETPGDNRFLKDWVRFDAQRTTGGAPGERLAVLAAQLEDLAGKPVPERLGLLDEYLRFVRTSRIETLQHRWLSTPEAPTYWVDDVCRMIDADTRALNAKAPPRLDEWPDDIDANGCAERLRQTCLALAVAYRHWPALWRAAADLGRRLLP